MPVILEAHDLTKSYPLGATVVEALRGVSLSVAGRRVRRPDGPVGLGQVARCSSSSAASTGRPPARSSSRARRSASCPTTARRGCAAIGPASSSSRSTSSRCSTSSENVALPFTIAGEDPTRGELAERVRDVIELVDLTGKEHHKPGPAVGRRAAARRRRPGARHPAGAPLRRRADRQPRLHDRHRDPRRPLALVRRARPDDRPRHPRLEGGRLRRPRARHRRRADPRDDRARPARPPRRHAAHRPARPARAVGRSDVPQPARRGEACAPARCARR